MKFSFSGDKSFKIRHKILETLHEDWEENNRDDSRRVGSIKIASKTGISISDIHLYQYLLVDKGEIVISDNDGQSFMSIQQKGISAFIDKRYLKEGKKALWDGVFDWARILLPLGILILSIINFISNKNLSDKMKIIENRIEKIEKIIIIK